MKNIKQQFSFNILLSRTISCTCEIYLRGVTTQSSNNGVTEPVRGHAYLRPRSVSNNKVTVAVSNLKTLTIIGPETQSHAIPGRYPPQYNITAEEIAMGDIDRTPRRFCSFQSYIKWVWLLLTG